MKIVNEPYPPNAKQLINQLLGKMCGVVLTMVSLPNQIRKHIKKAYLFKIGSVYIIPDAKIDDNELFDKLIQCLAASPLITKVYKLSPSGKPSTLNIWRLMEIGRIKDKLLCLEFSPFITCRFHLPTKNQEIGKILESFVTSENIDWTENFNIIYNGSIFLIYREIDPLKRAHPGSEDVRDMFFTVLKKSKTWHLKEIAPTPLREDVIMTFLVENKDTAELIGKTFVGKQTGDLIFCFPESVLKRLEQFAADFLSMIASDLTKFYNTVCTHDELEICRDRLEQTHIELKSVVEKLQKLHFYNVYTHHRELKLLENLISRHFSYILDYNLIKENLTKDVEDLRTGFERNIFLKHLSASLLKELAYEEIDVDTLTKCTDYVNEITKRSYANKITLLAAILTIIGSTLGSLIIDYVRSVL
jgi:hypothetical protein